MNVWNAQAWLFDMDGVLADNCRYHVLAWQAFTARYGTYLTEELVLGWMGATNQVYMERLFGRPVFGEELTALENEKESLYREIFAPHLKMPPGLRDLLDAAHAKNIRCAVATGAPQQNVDFVLDGLGIRDDFVCVVDPSQYANSKPAPDCYLRAASNLDAPPSGCIVFEDAVNGIAAGHAAGMRVVAIATTNPRAVLESAGADLVIDSFQNLNAVNIFPQ